MGDSAEQTLAYIDWSKIRAQLAAPKQRGRVDPAFGGVAAPDPDDLTVTAIAMLNSKGGRIVVNGVVAAEPALRMARGVLDPHLTISQIVDRIDGGNPNTRARIMLSTSGDDHDSVTMDLAPPIDWVPILASRTHTYWRDASENRRVDLKWNGTPAGLRLSWFKYLHEQREEHIKAERRHEGLGMAPIAFLLLPFLVVLIWGAFAEPPAGVFPVSAVIGGAGFLVADIAVLVWIFSMRRALYERMNFPASIRPSSKGERSRMQRALQAKADEEKRGMPGARPDDGPSYYPSRRQMQHEWYEGHSELDWRDRERGELYGIDVETYIANVLENDKD